MRRFTPACSVLVCFPAAATADDKPVFWYCQAFNTPNNPQYKVEHTVDRGWSRVAESLRDHVDLRVTADRPTARRLADVDLVIIANPEKDPWEGGPRPLHMRREDVDALTRFILDGGALLFASNQSWLHNIEKKHSNRLLERFGLRMGHEDVGLKILPIPENTPAIGGLTWRFFFGSRIEQVPPTLTDAPIETNVWVWNDPKAKLLEGKPGSRWPLLVVVEAGKGKLALVADIGWTANGTVGLDDNWPILWKLFDALTTQSMGPFPPPAQGAATETDQRPAVK